MKAFFAVLLSAAVALAEGAVGKLAINDFPAEGAVAGTSYTVTYTAPDQTKPVTILLRNGDPGNLETVDTLTTTATGGTFIWVPSTDLVNGDDYAVQIEQDDQINWIGPFVITGGSDEPVVTDEATVTDETTVTETTEVDTATATVTKATDGVAKPTGTGNVGTTVTSTPSGSGNTTKPTKTPSPGEDSDDEDDTPPPFEGSASKAAPAFAAVVLGAIALLA